VNTLIALPVGQAARHTTRESPDPNLIAAAAAALVGSLGVDEVQHQIRQSMLAEALRQSQGNLTRAARLLGVTRQAVQQMLDRYQMRRPLSATG
jgi:transcriptional regulator with GAF, ATPase, and Fis domain